MSVINKKSKYMFISTGIPEKEVEEIATILNTLLADEYSLFTKTRSAHWNVTGPNFYELHNLFENQYVELDKMIGDIAERVRSLGHYALGSLPDFLSVTHLIDEKHDFGNSREMLHTLMTDHELIIRLIRNNIIPSSAKLKDLSTSGFILSIMEKHEKMAWMLRASLPSTNMIK